MPSNTDRISVPPPPPPLSPLQHRHVDWQCYPSPVQNFTCASSEINIYTMIESPIGSKQHRKDMQKICKMCRARFSAPAGCGRLRALCQAATEGRFNRKHSSSCAKIWIGELQTIILRIHKALKPIWDIKRLFWFIWWGLERNTSCLHA